MSNLNNQLLVLGVGNQYRRDDGIGIEVVTKLQQLQIPHLDPIIGGTDGLGLLDIIAKYPRTIIVDAVNMNESAGTIKLFSPAEVKLIQSDSLSTHGIGIAEVLELMAKLGLSTQVQILGIQPEDLSFGEGLSTRLSKLVDEIILKINEAFNVLCNTG